MERISQATEGPDRSRPGLDSPAGALWLFAVTSQASRELQAHRLDEAEATCNDVLAMLEVQPPSVHQQRHVARAYHNLGMVAQDRGRLDDAEAWYRRSLETRQERRNCPGMATTCAALSLLGEERQQLSEAMRWAVRCVTLCDGFPHPATGTGPAQLARLTERLGMEALEACWEEVTGGSLPEAVRTFVLSDEGEAGPP